MTYCLKVQFLLPDKNILNRLLCYPLGNDLKNNKKDSPLDKFLNELSSRIDLGRNPFHGRFTHKGARFWYGKLLLAFFTVVCGLLNNSNYKAE